MYNTIIFLSVLQNSSGLRAQHNVSDSLNQADDTSLVQSWLPSCCCFGKKDREPIAEDPQVIADAFEPMQIRVRVTNGDCDDIDLGVSKSTTVEMLKQTLKREYTRVQGRKFFTDHPFECSYGDTVLSDSTTLRELDVENQAQFDCKISEVEQRMWQEEEEKKEQERIAKRTTEEIENGTFNGHGKYTDYYGKTYEGEFKDGAAHGNGCLVSRYGDKIEGEWQNGRMHGFGTRFRFKVKEYEGEWRNGNRHGQGAEFYGDKKKYEGQWERGKYHGHGKAICDAGRTYEGEWKNGKHDGFGTSTWGDARQYVGHYKDGARHGSGIWTSALGEDWQGQWENGRRTEWKRVE